jgi:glycosyl transferase family 25
MNHRPLPPIWVINMKRSVDRRAYIRAQLDGLGLDYELVEGVDGKELSAEDLVLSYSSSAALAVLGRELTTGEIGCSLSHLRLYQRQVEEGHEAVVILEDDVVVDPSFLEVMDRRDALPADWRYRCVKFAGIADGTQGYLLRQSGARKLFAHGHPVRVPADCLTGGMLKTGVCLYGLDPPCIRECASGPAHSTMPENYALHRKWPTREELGRLGWFKHTVRWGLIHAFRRFNPFSIV